MLIAENYIKNNNFIILKFLVLKQIDKYKKKGKRGIKEYQEDGVKLKVRENKIFKTNIYYYIIL